MFFSHKNLFCFPVFFFKKKTAPSPLDRLCPFKSLAVMTPSPSRSKVLKALLQHSFERPGVVGSVDGSVASGWTPVGLWAQVDIDMTWLGRNWDGWGGAMVVVGQWSEEKIT